MTATTELPGQPHIHYSGDQLHVEGLPMSPLACEHGTPLFVYSKADMLSALAAYQRGFAGRQAQICYAMKGYSSLAILQVFAEAGCGFDIVSGGELARVLAAGGDPAKGRLNFLNHGLSHCSICHSLPGGTDHNIDELNNTSVVDFVKSPPLLQSYQKEGIFTPAAGRTLSGFGFGHDGTGTALPLPHFYFLSVMDVEQLISKLEKGRLTKKTSSIIIVAEGNKTGGATELAEQVNKKYHLHGRKFPPD